MGSIVMIILSMMLTGLFVAYTVRYYAKRLECKLTKIWVELDHMNLRDAHCHFVPPSIVKKEKKK